ncbi:hypothetical protein GF325_16195 [Candidatus Bathyarchaeota archaeon]|nr:hypothetical protein [Candidatus Bathyarchaeota archaeon]
MVQPFPLLLQARCQNMTMEQEIMVEREGVNHFFIPVHMPDHGMTPVQNAPFSLKILDASGVQIKEARETVSIVPYGPLFAIKSLRINQAGGIDQFEVVVDLFNDGKVKATLNADLLIKIPTRSELESLDSQKLTLGAGASKQIVFTKIDLPLDAITHHTFKLFVLITVTSFQKVKNLLVRDIKPESMIPMKERLIILGDIKNLDNTRKITNETDKVSLEVELHWRIPLHKCKVKLIEFIDGTEYTVLKTISIPKKKMDLYTSIYWSPPKAKKHPRFCKLELRLYQDDQRVAGDAVQFTSRFFTIYP